MTERTFDLPDVGEGVAEGELLRWLVEAGDQIEEDQPVAEVETDKAVVELPSPHAGVVTDLHADPGDLVPVGDPLVTVAVDDGDEGETEDEATGGRVFAPPRTRRLARELGVEIGDVEGSGPGGRITDADVRAAAEEGEEPTDDESTDDRPTPRSMADDATPVMERSEGDGPDPDGAARRESAAAVDRAAAAVPEAEPRRERTLAAPATRRLADELGVDIDAVPTDRSRDGVPFVTPDMVREHAEKRREAAEESADADADTASPKADEATDDGAEAAAGDAGDAEPRPGDRVPYRGVRRTIGERMERAAAEVPQVTHTDEVDVTALVETRADLADRAEAEGVTLTYLPFVLKAVARALADYPYVNATLDAESEEIVLHDDYHLGVATATDAGLLVPVVEDVDERGLLDLAEAIARKVDRARDRRIDREEMQGGTFTVTNVGAIGGRYSTPMVNPPEVAILALGRVERRPWVVDGTVTARHTLPLSLSVDHRVVDGATAARFTNRLKELLANPGRLLLDV